MIVDTSFILDVIDDVDAAVAKEREVVPDPPVRVFSPASNHLWCFCKRYPSMTLSHIQPSAHFCDSHD